MANVRDVVDVRDMVAEWLVSHGYDGLVSPDCNCGCDINDLGCCYENPGVWGCEPAYKTDCGKCSKRAGDCPHDYEYVMISDGYCADFEVG